jgi:hypothetical protein
MTTTGKYILINGVPTVETDLLTWMQWMEDHIDERIVRQEVKGESHFSTVFLGYDRAFGNGKPLLYETMVFDGPLAGTCCHYTSMEDACRGHEQVGEQLRDIYALIDEILSLEVGERE